MSKLDDMKKEVSTSDKREDLVRDIKKSLGEKIEEQKTIPQSPVKKEDTIFTYQDRKNLISKIFKQYKDKGIKLRRQEKKLIAEQEFDTAQRTRGTIIIIAVIGLIFIGLSRNFLPNEAMFTIILLMGMMMFFPLGMIAGWLFLDPIMRTKMLRRVSKRNYGIVWFVAKGMKAVGKMKNFDNGLIWKGNECWSLTKDKIVQMTKDGNTILEGKSINPGSIVTLVDTVPCMFVDLDSMEPLMLHQEGRIPVYPGEIGPSLKAWVDNQRAKMMALRKTQDILLVVAIIAACAAAVISLLAMNKIDQMDKTIKIMADQINQLVNPINIPPTP